MAQLNDRCSNCGRARGDAIHHCALRCRICGRVFTAMGNSSEACTVHSGKIAVANVGEKTLFVYVYVHPLSSCSWVVQFADWLVGSGCGSGQ